MAEPSGRAATQDGDAIASAARALVAAGAYASSGGSQYAPLLAGVLGGSRTVLGVLSGVPSKMP